MSNASLELGGDNWAAKDGNLLGYAVGDSSGKYVPREFTFTRGSNLAATRVAANGLIEKGRENLLLHSNSFNNWINSNTSETSGQSGYDGSSDAWLLTKTAASGFIFRSFSGSGVQTFSAYVKANASTWGLLQCIGGSNPYAYFDLGTGVVGSIGGGTISNSIEDVGGGWYRISLIHNTTISSARIYPAEANTASGTSGSIYIQDAQAEIGLVATEYIESGATTGLAGILEDSPRFDYSGGASCPSLLLEGSRSNLIEYSEYFGGSNWFVGGGYSFITNADTSPEGVQNATEFTIPSTGATVRSTISVTASTDYVFSFYVKRGTATELIYSVYDVTNTSDIVAKTSYYSQTSSSEWKRIDVPFTTPSGCTNIIVYIDRESQGNGTAYFWGAQLEEGSYATSYIPNHSGGSVTRGADDLNDFDISSMLTSSSFTWFLDLNDYIGSDLNQETIFLESSPNLKIQLRVRPDGYRFYYNNIAGGSAYPIAGSKTANKFCVSYDGSNYRLYIDGILEATTASVGDSGWDFIKNATGASLPLKQMLLFPTALSDAQCSALTVEGLKEEILTSYIAAVDTLEDGAEARLDTYLQNLEELIV